MTVKSLRNVGGGMGLRRRGAGGGLQTAMMAGAGLGANEAGISFYYDRLMQVAIRNTFYNTAGGQCPDFTVAQSRHTQKLCKSLGLIVRNEGAGFSVLYDTLRAEGLERYLRKHSPRPAQIADDGAGTRLSFALTLRNPDFCYFTDMPFDLDPNDACYYLSNRMAHDAAGRVILNEKTFVPQSAPLPAVDGQYEVLFPDGVTEIEVLDVLGNVLQCYPRVVPVDLVEQDLAAVDSCDKVSAYLRKYPGAATESRQVCTINFYLLPAGCYTIRFVGGSEPDRTVIYRAEFYQALCFIDLFMANPVAGGPGIFPVKDLADPDKTTIETVAYDVDFAARSTVWEYFIVPPAKDARLHDLQITRRNGAPIAFSAATKVDIGLGTMAWAMHSAVPLTIRSSTDYDFKLTGRIQDPAGMTGRDTTLMPRLPVAPSDWVLPPSRNNNTAPVQGPSPGKSDIYVYL